MESFHITNYDSGSCQKSYDFSSEDLADIPCPDEVSAQETSSPPEDVELPLPPGTSGDDFPIPLPPKQEFLTIFNNFSPSLPLNKALNNTPNLNHVLEPENFNILPLDENGQQKCEQRNIPSKSAMFLDNAKYSPSKVDSDEENQDFITIKPKVLGKEQAKKRLMAFSLTKQTNVAVKKQNKAFAPAKNREKPPHPNKSSNVQDQFRATISAIEEEKKKMFQNMPSYLLLEMSELAKSLHSGMSSSTQLLEKLKSESAELKKKKSLNKDGTGSFEGVKSKRNFIRSRSRSSSRSKSKRRKRSRSKRRSRSRSRSKRSLSKSRRSSSKSRRSRSKSRRSTSRTERVREDKVKREKVLQEILLKKKLYKNWHEFKATSLSFEKESGPTKNRFDESKSRRDEHSRKSKSPSDRHEFKPVFDYLNKSPSQMTFLQAKPSDSTGTALVLFPERIIKYTRTKPILCWAENPSHATDYYMSKQMLLENCDPAISNILLAIIENKCAFEANKKILEIQSKSRPWYPHKEYLMPSVFNTEDGLNSNKVQLQKSYTSDVLTEESHVKALEKRNEIINKEDISKGQSFPEKKISLVNDSYLSEEEDQDKEVIVGDLKVHLDLDMNNVKVRSKWDSDYDGEYSEKESVSWETKNREQTVTSDKEEFTIKANEKLTDEFDVAPCEPKLQDYTENKKLEDSVLVPHGESPSLNASDNTTGNLVSEYEEFLKMVSVDSNDNQGNEKTKAAFECKPKSEKSKIKKLEKPSEENWKIQSPKPRLTDWDQESDHELKLNIKKMMFAGSHDEVLIPQKDEHVDAISEEEKKKSSKKKTHKLKSKKNKSLRKTSKGKKKKYENSLSENSTSESYESDLDSNSDVSVLPKKSKKKKKKKISKAKKKCKDDSSRSDNELDGKTKKNKSRKKKNGKTKKSNGDDSDEADTALLKHLDFKKQLIMKRIEEIDSISDKSIKKKEKESRGKKIDNESSEETDSELYINSKKRKKIEDEIDKKKSKSSIKKSKLSGKTKKSKSNKSFSESSDENSIKTKAKRAEKRKRYYSESSGSEEKTKSKSKSSNKSSKKTKKSKKDSSSSDSDDSENSWKNRKKTKKKKNKVKNSGEKLDKAINSSFKENLIPELDSKNDERSAWENKTLWEKSERKMKKKKRDDNWETSSSAGKSEQESKTRESSWDDEVKVTVRESKIHASEDSLSKDGLKNSTILPKQGLNESNSTSTPEVNNLFGSGTLKTSLSNFSFNENSFCSFGQELSRDFFLAERSYSNSGLNICENLRTTLIEPRPFQSVSKDSDTKKPSHSELYSPGYSDSEVSETEIHTSEKGNGNSIAKNVKKDDVYDPLNCESDGSAENKGVDKAVELSNIPLPHGFDTLLPDESRNLENVSTSSTSSSESNMRKDLPLNKTKPTVIKKLLVASPVKYSFTPSEFTPVTASDCPINDEKSTPTKRQLMSVKGQQKLISKAASVFQDESDEENFEPCNKRIDSKNSQSKVSDIKKEKILVDNKNVEKHFCRERQDEVRKRNKENRSRSRERSTDREKEERKRRSRSRSRERRSSSRMSKKAFSPKRRRKSRTPEFRKEKREIRSDSFEIEPLKSSLDSNELSRTVQPIPVLTGLEPSLSDSLWSKSIVSGCEFQHTIDTLIDHSESFDIYPSEESKFKNRSHDKDFAYHDRLSFEKSKDGKSKRERWKSRSKSCSPKKRHRSKSPERRRSPRSPRSRSPRRKSASPKRWDKSPFSPRRSPKRKSPPRRYKISRSPDKKRKSPSRSPRKRRSSPSRLSRSVSPRKYWSPKHRDESPRKRDSVRMFSSNDRFSPVMETQCSQPYPSGLQNRIPVIGALPEDDMELSPSTMRSNPMDFPPDPSVAESEMYSSFYEGEYSEEYGVSGYSEEVGVNNLITVKNHDIEKANSPERLSLDQRIELELNIARSGPQAQSDQYQMQTPVCPLYQEINQSHFQNSYNCDSTNISTDNFYQSPSVQMNPDFNGQYFNGQQQQPPPQNYGSFQQYPNSQPVQNSVLQVGNIVEVVPSLQHPPPPPPPLPSKAPQIMQVGNVLQVVPSQKVTPPVPSPVPHNYGLPDASPIMKTQKATAVVAPSSIVPTPNPEAILNPLIRAIQLEREKRRKEKEKRKAEREARRKARQLRREAKLMSVNEKLKKSVENEGLMLGQEVEDDELLDGLDVPSPPIPVEIITVSSPSALPPAGKGILITAGFMPKPPSEKKEVKFADGVCPGEGTSTSGEDVASPPPKPKLPKEKRFKKKKTKVKKKVKVQIIKQIIQEEDDDEDDLSPPPPPPGDPPPVFFARFPYANDAQFPVYQTQTTTTTLTTVQYPPQTFE